MAIRTKEPVPVSFLEAYQLKNLQEISWDRYIEHLFARCKGIKHEDDNPKLGHWGLRYEDPFGYAVWRWCKTVPVMTDATPFEDVFKTYRKGSLDEVKQKLDALPKEYERGIRKIQAFLALQDRRADVLKFCVEKDDFPYEAYFEDEANMVEPEKDPETFKVLEESQFRKVYPRRAKNPDSERVEKSSGAPRLRLSGKAKREKTLMEIAATFDVGGSHPVDW
jgi:hypothetical protein